MPANLLKPNEKYYHHLTRKMVKPHVIRLDVEGNITGESVVSVQEKDSLTAEDIVRYYYESCNMKSGHQNQSRDVGSVNFLVNKLGLDATLFCIEALISEYLEGEDRDSYPPPLIKAGELTSYAADRMGQAKLIFQQFK